MVEVVVEFEYEAEEEDELTIKKGDIITNVDKQDGGWWSGELNGKKGVFPDNFVKELSKEEQKVPKEVKKEAHGQTEIADRLQNILSKGGGPAFAPPGIQKRLNNPSKRQIRAKAAFSYAPENEDELKLDVGDVIEVLRQEEEGWWEGTINGKVGVFPSNFVEVMLEDGTIAKPEDVVLPETAGGEQGKVEVQGKKVKGVGLGNIFANGPIVLKKAGNKDEPTKMVRSRQSVVVESSPTAAAKKTVSPVPVAGPKKSATPAVPRDLPKPVMQATPKELPNLPPKDIRDNSVILDGNLDKGKRERSFAYWEYPTWCSKSPLFKVQELNFIEEDVDILLTDSQNELCVSSETDKSSQTLKVILEEGSECPVSDEFCNESSHYGQGDEFSFSMAKKGDNDYKESRIDSEGDSVSDTISSSSFSQSIKMQHERLKIPHSMRINNSDQDQQDLDVYWTPYTYDRNPCGTFFSPEENLHPPEFISSCYLSQAEESSIWCPDPTPSPQGKSYRKRQSLNPLAASLAQSPLLQSTPNSDISIPLKKQRLDSLGKLTPLKRCINKLLVDPFSSNKENIVPCTVYNVKSGAIPKKLECPRQDEFENIGKIWPSSHTAMKWASVSPKGKMDVMEIGSRSPGEIVFESEGSCYSGITHSGEKTSNPSSKSSLAQFDFVDVGVQRDRVVVSESPSDSTTDEIHFFSKNWLLHPRLSPIHKLHKYVSGKIAPTPVNTPEIQSDSKRFEVVGDVKTLCSPVELNFKDYNEGTENETEQLTYLDMLEKQGRLPRSLRLLYNKYQLKPNKYNSSFRSNSGASDTKHEVPEENVEEDKEKLFDECVSNLHPSEAKLSLISDEGAKGEGYCATKDTIPETEGASGSESAHYFIPEGDRMYKSKFRQFLRYVSSGFLRRTRSAGNLFHRGTKVTPILTDALDPVVFTVDFDCSDGLFDVELEVTPTNEDVLNQSDLPEACEACEACSNSAEISSSVGPCLSDDQYDYSDSPVSNKDVPDTKWPSQYEQTCVTEVIERDAKVSEVLMNQSSIENWFMLHSVLGADELHELSSSSTTIDTPVSFGNGESQILGSFESDYDLSNPDLIRALLESEFQSGALLLSSEDASEHGECESSGLLDISGYACMFGLTGEESCDGVEETADNTTLTDHSSNMSNMSDFLLNMSSNAQQYYSLTLVSDISEPKEDESYYV